LKDGEKDEMEGEGKGLLETEDKDCHTKLGEQSRARGKGDEVEPYNHA
jgi:hypothetical protein